MLDLSRGLVIRPDDRDNDLFWQCPKCGADPGVKCYVVVNGGKLKIDHDYGTHLQRKRLALFFKYNPDHAFDRSVWDFANRSRD